jgi:hypothetical protein
VEKEEKELRIRTLSVSTYRIVVLTRETARTPSLLIIHRRGNNVAREKENENPLLARPAARQLLLPTAAGGKGREHA